ncbi:hypothetical protein [Paracoccus sp. (in: a-proteobacteria)]|uniref:hypothetical protein n=1 Tax=Paracoccus sp. TaxID=267 RepID=UPI002AFF9A7A|nr:hypothetical protein [Paracoccus sp. (in: a-proteobacteria)]
MSTRAQIAIQLGPEEWAHVYVQFDGYPAHMLPPLARWKPEDILSAREIRQVTPEALDCFSPPRDPPHPAASDAGIRASLHVDRMPVGACGAAGRCPRSVIIKQ